MLLVTSAALKNHLIRFIAGNVFGRLPTVYPPTNRIECRKSNCKSKDFMTESLCKVDRIAFVVDELGVKK